MSVGVETRLPMIRLRTGPNVANQLGAADSLDRVSNIDARDWGSASAGGPRLVRRDQRIRQRWPPAPNYDAIGFARNQIVNPV
jgi:hypothetical protein